MDVHPGAWVRKVGFALISPRTARGLRFDLMRLATRLRGLPNRRLRPTQPALHVGCGGRLVPGFLNVDVRSGDARVDLAAQLPWVSGSFDRVVSQHVIEHLDMDHQLPRLLQEIWRVMKPGGKLWLSCPDMEAIARSYLHDAGATLRRDRQSRFPAFSLGGRPDSQMVNELFHQNGEHLNLFDFPLLAHLLEGADFVDVQRSNEATFLKHHPGFPRRDDDAFSLYVRARKALTH